MPDCSKESIPNPSRTNLAIDFALLILFQGQERTKAEFDALITEAGLEVVSLQKLGNVICAIECKRNDTQG